MNFKRFPFFQQLDRSDCGLSCLRMIAKYHHTSLPYNVIEHQNITTHGISVSNLIRLANKIGFETEFSILNFDEFTKFSKCPFIVHSSTLNHYIVVYKINEKKLVIADPEKGFIKITKPEFVSTYGATLEGYNNTVFYSIIVTPTDKIIKRKIERLNLSSILKYSYTYKTHVILLFVGVLIGSTVEVLLPFLTKKLVDLTISHFYFDLVVYILAAQIVLSISRVVIEFIRSWLIAHISSRINLRLVWNTLTSLFDLPFTFFSSKSVSDLIQRVNDTNTVESFVTDSLTKTLFSVLSLFVLSILLVFINTYIFLIFCAACLLEFIWVSNFLSQLKFLKKHESSILSEYHSKLHEIISGIQEIKISNSSSLKRSEWKLIQDKLFNYKLKHLKTNQLYNTYKLFYSLVYVIITYICCREIFDDKMTVGTMMGIFFILGQLSSPFTDVINCLLHWQYTRNSLDRLGEISLIRSEIGENKFMDLSPSDNFPITFKNVYFRYVIRSDDFYNLNNINFEIPKNKITAVVGISGSGKTTLIKLLLKLYKIDSGSILIGNSELSEIHPSVWRDKCGSVLQDSYIFSESIAYNITLSNEIDEKNLAQSIITSNLQNFIDSLPMGLKTRIGQNGWGLSQGQKQRILIARVIYKNPSYIFFDEATNSLDTENELIIMNNLQNFFENKTVLIVAHRLSTVKHADQILVMKDGSIIESGTHSFLTNKRSHYYHLVQNQLNLGN